MGRNVRARKTQVQGSGTGEETQEINIYFSRMLTLLLPPSLQASWERIAQKMKRMVVDVLSFKILNEERKCLEPQKSGMRRDLETIKLHR